MARPKSDERRSAILSAAVCIIAAEGLGAATASIARTAGVSNGSLFTYFDTKTDLLNQLYVQLKSEVAETALRGLVEEHDHRGQMQRMSRQWLQWGVAWPEKRRALAYLSVSDDIASVSRETASRAMAGVAALIERSRKNGPMREAPPRFVADLINAIADTTMDAMIDDPANADEYAATATAAMWRMLEQDRSG